MPKEDEKEWDGSGSGSGSGDLDLRSLEFNEVDSEDDGVKLDLEVHSNTKRFVEFGENDAFQALIKRKLSPIMIPKKCSNIVFHLEL